MLSQSDMDKAVLEAKKSLSDEQIKDAVRKCSYGGNPATMQTIGGYVTDPEIYQKMRGGEIINGKTNR